MTSPGPSVADHLAACLTIAHRLEPLTVALSDAQGCLLVGDVLAPGPLPAFGTAQLDGYAVRVADVVAATPQQPVLIPVVGSVLAGATELPVSVQPGFAVRVGVGAPLPAGAETVVPMSWTDGGLTRVAVLQAPPPGAWSRLVGEDLTAGSLLLADGTPLGPPQLALLAAAGLARVHVRPRPRAVIVSTGRGLVDIGAPAGPGQVPDANSHAARRSRPRRGCPALPRGHPAAGSPAADRHARGPPDQGRYRHSRRRFRRCGRDSGQDRHRALEPRRGRPRRHVLRRDRGAGQHAVPFVARVIRSRRWSGSSSSCGPCCG